MLRVLTSVLCAVVVLPLAPELPDRQELELRADHEHRAWFCRLVLDPHDQFTRVVPPPMPRGFARASAVTSSITVNYTGFTAEAQTAFQYAVDIWEQNVASPVPIVVDAEFQDLGSSNLLGQAGPDVYRDFFGAPRSGTWYPKALANRLVSSNLDGSSVDIGAEFNSTRELVLRSGRPSNSR